MVRGSWGCMEMVWGYVFRAVWGRNDLVWVHFWCCLVDACGGVGQRGVPLVGGGVNAWAVWRVKNHEKIENFEKLQNGLGVSGMHGNGMGICF